MSSCSNTIKNRFVPRSVLYSKPLFFLFFDLHLALSLSLSLFLSHLHTRSPFLQPGPTWSRDIITGEWR